VGKDIKEDGGWGKTCEISLKCREGGGVGGGKSPLIPLYERGKLGGGIKLRDKPKMILGGLGGKRYQRRRGVGIKTTG
jgi:hypothetical protein